MSRWPNYGKNAYRASNVLFNYSGEGLDFWQLMECFTDQIEQELSPFPDTLGDELDEDMKIVNQSLEKSAQEMREAKAIALEIYERHLRGEEDKDEDTIRRETVTEMREYEGNEWVNIIGRALDQNDWSLLAI